MENKKKFTVEITETLQRQVEVEAEDEFEAEDIVREMYRNEEIVLDAEDYIDTEFEVLEDDADDKNYLIIEEDGTKHYYEDEPDVGIIHGFVVEMGVDITLYKKIGVDDWEEVDSYHA